MLYFQDLPDNQAINRRAQTQRRIQVLLARRLAVERLVGADVDRAHRHRHALHAFDGPAVGVELLFLVG